MRYTITDDGFVFLNRPPAAALFSLLYSYA